MEPLENTFHIMNARNGSIVRVANDDEILAWGLGQTHPMFWRGEACFDRPVRLSETETVIWCGRKPDPSNYGSSFDWL